MKKHILIGFLFALLIALTAAQAQVYVAKTGINLATGFSERGNGLYFDYSNGKIIGTFPRYDAQVQSLYFPLGTTLNEQNSFFAKFKIKTPATLAADSPYAGAQFGFFKSSDTVSTRNSLVLYIAPFTGTAYNYVCNNNYQCETLQFSTAFQTNTEYFITMYYDSTTQQFTVSIYNANEQLLETKTRSASIPFSVDAVGLMGYAEGGAATPLPWSNNFEITAIKANAGTAEYGHIINPQSNVKYTLSDNTDLTLNPQTGTQTVYIKTSDNRLVGQATVNFDQATLDDIDMPELILDTSSEDGKSLMHHTTAFPDTVTAKLLVPKLAGATGCYHCPLTGLQNPTLADVVPTCTGVTFPSCTTVNIGGQDYWVMDNQGGGNGGSSVPEFSDIAWVLAAVLGAGGFVLIRRKLFK